ncbi:MAG: carboxylesterase family protein, partial [Lachnospiraceae bacterium]|nr:carboxylesterase family protein [Lachnospiraceae bacterium]
NRHKRVPMIVGYNRGEVNFFGNADDQKEDADISMIVATRMFGHIQDSQNRKTYIYEFDADIPGDDNAGSYHGSEMWFAYDALARCDRAFTGKHYDLARQISSYWTNFVKTGDPNGVDTFGFELPRWESFTTKDEFVMLFKDTPEVSPKKTDEKMKKIISEKAGINL